MNWQQVTAALKDFSTWFSLNTGVPLRGVLVTAVALIVVYAFVKMWRQK